jgi:hypothetical protein
MRAGGLPFQVAITSNVIVGPLIETTRPSKT